MLTVIIIPVLGRSRNCGVCGVGQVTAAHPQRRIRDVHAAQLCDPLDQKHPQLWVEADQGKKKVT